MRLSTCRLSFLPGLTALRALFVALGVQLVTGQPAAQAQFCYVPNANDNSISGYTVDPATGALTAITGSPFRAGLTPYYTPESVLVHPTGKFAYVVSSENGGMSTVSGYTIEAATGALTPIPGSPFQISGGQYSFGGAIDPSGKLLYVTLQNLFPYDYGGVFGFTIDPNSGALTPVSGSPFPTAAGAYGGWLTVDPTDRFLYMTNISFDLSTDSVSGFTIDPTTGALTPITGSPFPTGSGAAYVAVHPNGKFAYVTNIFANAVSGYTIDSTSGALTPITGSPFPTGSQPYGVVVDPSGSFAYVKNSADNTVSGYAINSATGALTPMTGSPFSTGVGGQVVAVDPSDTFAYTPNFRDSTVSGFAINPTTGALTSIAGSPFPTGLGPGGIAFTPPQAFGFDISPKYLTKPPRNLSSAEWQTLANDGFTSVIVGAWGGKTSNPPGLPTLVHDLLAGAHGVNLKTGAYCLLNFVAALNESGSYQVQKALDAIGPDQKQYLSFVAIDAELKPPSLSKTLSTDECITRIADAIEEVRFEGLQPVLYTSVTFWDQITSMTPKKLNSGTREISGVPLWDSRFDGSPNLSFTGSSKYDRPYGTWTTRLGKQYEDGPPIDVGNGQTINADRDIFDPSAFSLPPVAPGSFPSLNVIQLLTRQGKHIYLTGSISDTGLADALATRITVATLNGISAQFEVGKTRFDVSASSPYRMNTIPAGGSALVNLKFPAAGLKSGSQGTLEISGTFGGGTFAFPFSVTIP